MEIQLNFLRLFVILPKIYALFFVSLFKTLIQMTNVYLHSNAIFACSTVTNEATMITIENEQWHHNSYVTNVIKHYKHLHFELFMASVQINETFGWSLVAICAETLLENAYMIYWIFYYWHREDQEFLLITSNMIAYSLPSL